MRIRCSVLGAEQIVRRLPLRMAMVPKECQAVEREGDLDSTETVQRHARGLQGSQIPFGRGRDEDRNGFRPGSAVTLALA